MLSCLCAQAQVSVSQVHRSALCKCYKHTVRIPISEGIAIELCDSASVAVESAMHPCLHRPLNSDSVQSQSLSKLPLSPPEIRGPFLF